jgi:hypothetical protein
VEIKPADRITFVMGLSAKAKATRIAVGTPKAEAEVGSPITAVIFIHPSYSD